MSARTCGPFVSTASSRGARRRTTALALVNDAIPPIIFFLAWLTFVYVKLRKG